MNLIDIVLLGIALGIDCLIVSFSQGLIFKEQRVKNSLRLAFCMGLFQGVMPVIGYIAAEKVYNIIIPYGKWIVFSIFFILGTNFILQAISKQKKETVSCIGFKCLLSLSVATSIDALIAGTTLKLTSTNLLSASLIIGILSFIMSITGFWCGNYIKNIREKFLHILGGIILIILALKSII